MCGTCGGELCTKNTRRKMTGLVECPICFEKKSKMIKYHSKDASYPLSKDGHESCAECWARYVEHIRWNGPYVPEHIEMERKTGLRPLECPFCRDIIHHIDVHSGTNDNSRSRHEEENRCVSCTMSCMFYGLSILSCCIIMN